MSRRVAIWPQRRQWPGIERKHHQANSGSRPLLKISGWLHRLVKVCLTVLSSFCLRLERTYRQRDSDATSVMNKLNFMLQSIKEAQSFTFQPGMIPGYGVWVTVSNCSSKDRVGGDLTSFYQNTMEVHRRIEPTS